MSQPAIRIEQLTKRYGDMTAVDSLDLEIAPAEIFGLLGPNGAGKSTVISTILGIKRPTSGSVTVLGLDSVHDARKIRALTGYVMQQIAHDKFLSGRENCSLHAGLFGLKRQERSRRVHEVLEWAGLLDAADRIVNTYSGGMMRRLDLAISMLHHPRLIVLDEPTIGLDIKNRRRLWEMIGRMREQGTTILLTTHYLEEASQLCDRVGIMHLGKRAGLGTPEHLMDSVTSGEHAMEIDITRPDVIDMVTLPAGSLISDSRITITAPPRQLWSALGNIQNAAPESIRAVRYREPTLDDVFLKLTGSEIHR